MLLLILLGIFTAFLSLAFALLHLMASLSELRKHKNTLGNRLLLIGSNLATFSHPLLPFADCCFIPLLIGVSLICYGAYWNGKHKGNFHLVAHYLIRIGIALVITILLTLV